MRPLRLATLATASALLLACSPSTSESPPKKVLFKYWYTPDHATCARMSGRDYCVPQSDKRAANFETDSGPGFLVEMPITDPELIKCNYEHYKLDDYYEYTKRPTMQLSFGGHGIRQGDSISDDSRDLYDHLRSQYITENKSDDLVRPKNYSIFYGLNCANLKKDSLTSSEMMCFGGAYGSKNPPFFFSCNWDGMFPNPACTLQVFVDNMDLDASYNKKCGPYHQLIKQRMIEYLRSLRVTRSERNG